MTKTSTITATIIGIACSSRDDRVARHGVNPDAGT